MRTALLVLLVASCDSGVAQVSQDQVLLGSFVLQLLPHAPQLKTSVLFRPVWFVSLPSQFVSSPQASVVETALMEPWHTLVLPMQA